MGIKDIALRLQLSPSTVSRALNGMYGVSAATKARVLEAARALGYVPNLGAKQLVGKGSGLAGLFAPILEEFEHSGFLDFYNRMQQELRRYGKDTILFTLPYVGYTRGKLAEYAGSRGLEGCILLHPFGEGHPLVEEALSIRLPCVNFESVTGESCASVVSDDAEGGRMAGRYLLERGHRSFAYVDGPPSRVCRERLAGFREALKAGGIDPAGIWILQGDFSGESGANAAERIAERAGSARPTAVFCANDRMAAGAVMRFAELGLLVPRDFSVIGYDGDAYGAYLNPPLTTVRHARLSICSMAATRLVEMIEGGSGTLDRVRPELVERKSVANRFYSHPQSEDAR
ncbi:LacI family DNA-binding transcriptional regulator [Cohnella sp. CFH 77786]|uniref:LacI family DNA-binding transcriptional regulator n=1 Tax=Cohnella sp. CFH 77786 TaxID=2662265 RepID=UPI001C60DF92|nr:LacI family DNA-binding transcriptional regulator [Cohnella sp. CFH 77786]